MNTPLLSALIFCPLKIIKLLLGKGADISNIYHAGFHPISFIYILERRDVVQFLTAKETDPEIIYCRKGQAEYLREAKHDKTNLLVFACVKGDYEMVKHLVKNGISINQTDNGQRTPLMYACMSGSERLVKYLLDRGASLRLAYNIDSIDSISLRSAYENGQHDFVRLLLTALVSKNDSAEKDYRRQVDEEIQKFLVTACSKGDHEMVEFLLENGIEVNQTISCNRKDVTEMLRPTFQFPDEKVYNFLPICFACSSGSESVVQVLIDNCADINKTDSIGKTPLWYACLFNLPKSAKLALQKGAIINSDCMCEGRNILIVACEKGYKEIVEILVREGFNVNKDWDGCTPLMFACRFGHTQIVEFLLENGADVHKENEDGYTALMLSSVSGDKSSIQMLIEKGADVSKKNHEGYNCLDIASRYGNTDIVEFLIDKELKINLMTIN